MNNVKIWTTSNCNLQCKYCYEEISLKQQGNFNNKKKKRLINYLIKNKVESIIFHGGEPLLNFSLIKEIINKMNNEGVKINAGLTTNGTIWNDKIKKFFYENKEIFHHKMSISIDGCKKSMDSTRLQNGNSVYERVISVGDELKSIFPEIRVRITVVPKQIPNLLNNIRHLYKHGYKYIAVAFDTYSSDWFLDDYECLIEEYEKIISYWFDIKDLVLSLIDELCYINRKGMCKLGNNIYIDGNIYPCTYVVGNLYYCIGNIESGVLREKCIKFDNINCINNTFCISCKYKECCTYERCKIVNYCSTGDYYTPSEVGCTIENIKVKLAVKYQKQLLSEADKRL